ncbi:CZB domain-containing protein [Caulobacter soli]|uniref:CZB domain-containing protein n=1 Tax=Caulobacter soli TaxID=2708539 RepID=UPI0013EE1EF4|nr:CZB domain-containing protein [Caulobacter soli]
MDLQEQARLHGQVRDALQAAIDGQDGLDIAAFKSDRQCETGCWLHGEGQRRWAGNHAFLGLMEAHRAFHAAAGSVADQINRGRHAEAQRALRNGAPLAMALSDLNAAFRRMKATRENVAA